MWCVVPAAASFSYITNIIATVQARILVCGTMHELSDMLVTVHFFVGGTYSVTRMDTIWAFRQGYSSIVLQTLVPSFKNLY